MLTLENTDRYMVRVDGYNAAYVLTRKPCGTVEAREAYIPFGDAAAQWHENYDSMVRAHTNPQFAWFDKPWNDCLAELIEPYITD